MKEKFVEKYFGSKKFGSEIFLVHKNFGSKKVWVKKNFGSKKFGLEFLVLVLGCFLLIFFRISYGQLGELVVVGWVTKIKPIIPRSFAFYCLFTEQLFF